jgi:hypothetical protein
MALTQQTINKIYRPITMSQLIHTQYRQICLTLQYYIKSPNIILLQLLFIEICPQHNISLLWTNTAVCPMRGQ